MLHFAVKPLLPLFRELPPQEASTRSTLDAFLFPETFVYSLRIVAGELVAEPSEHEEEKSDPLVGLHAPDEVCAPWECFSPSNIEVCENTTDVIPSTILKKLLLKNGSYAFFKYVNQGDSRRIKRELKTYKQIKEAQLDDTVLIYRLHGLVLDDETGILFGLLLSYIDSNCGTLSAVTKPGTSKTLRGNWASQVRDTIKQLHNVGIACGDAKPDIILIDFAGGYSEGWIPKELVGTIESDQCGIAKIMVFLGVQWE